MTKHRRLPALFALLLGVAACDGGGSPTASSPNPDPPPAAATESLSGTVTSAASGRISGATVQIGVGPNAGSSANTVGSGRYEIAGLTTSGFTITVTAPGQLERGDGSAWVVVADGQFHAPAERPLDAKRHRRDRV